MNSTDLDDEVTNNILLDLSAKENEEEKEDIQQEEEVTEVQENSYKEEVREDIQEEKEDIQEEKEDIQEEKEEDNKKSIIHSLNSIVKLFIRYIYEIMKAGSEPLYNHDTNKS